jgi:hypothetical protein
MLRRSHHPRPSTRNVCRSFRVYLRISGFLAQNSKSSSSKGIPVAFANVRKRFDANAPMSSSRQTSDAVMLEIP